MDKYTIKHTPTGKYLVDTENGILLKDIPEDFSDAEQPLEDWLDEFVGENLYTDCGIFPSSEFEVKKIYFGEAFKDKK